MDLESAILAASDPRFPHRAQEAQRICDKFVLRHDVTIHSLNLFKRCSNQIQAFFLLRSVSSFRENTKNKKNQSINHISFNIIIIIVIIVIIAIIIIIIIVSIYNERERKNEFPNRKSLERKVIDVSPNTLL